jgi:hypothetical protein
MKRMLVIGAMGVVTLLSCTGTGPVNSADDADRTRNLDTPHLVRDSLHLGGPAADSTRSDSQQQKINEP